MNGAERNLPYWFKEERTLKKQYDEGAENEAARECYKIIMSTGNRLKTV